MMTVRTKAAVKLHIMHDGLHAPRLNNNVWPLMRIAPFIILLMVTNLFGLGLQPSVGRSAAVFTGKVLSVQKVRVVGDRPRWELWKAEVRVQTVIAQDVALEKSVFVYYAQNHVDLSFTNYVMLDIKFARDAAIAGCPPRPSIATNNVYQFFCIRRDVDDDKQLLFIPQGLWVR